VGLVPEARDHTLRPHDGRRGVVRAPSLDLAERFHGARY
jgi:hypothetical protein